MLFDAWDEDVVAQAALISMRFGSSLDEILDRSY